MSIPCRRRIQSSTTDCPNCGHRFLRHFCWRKKFVGKPIRTQRDSKNGRRAMTLLNQYKILKSILLRRTKKDRAADLSLPPRIVKLRQDSLDTNEEDFYTSIYNNSQAEFDTFVKQGMKNNCVHIFALLMRLRQAVNHFYLVEFSESAMKRSAGIGDDNNGEKVTSHAIEGFNPKSILNKIQLDGFQSSTKIDALCGVNCVQLDGSMSMDAKNAAIKRFTEDPDCRIFLLSLKAGGVALNLTVASHVFLMDPWWNPAIEKQAQDRIHRIGQDKPIKIVRFVIENTIEEKLLKLQQKKELAFEGTVDGSLEALGKLEEDDLRFLFS